MTKEKDQKQLHNIRHTLAHLLAQAVMAKYPHAKPTLGPPIDDGFYYDFDFSGGDAPGEGDLKSLEKTMRKTLGKWQEWESEEVSADEARKAFAGNEFKAEMIDNLEKDGETITLYTCGGFTDLCRGGHIENPRETIDGRAFKLSKIAGAYWRGSEENPMLTRIYGLAFKTKEDLAEHQYMIEEAKKRDHRKIGKEMDLFFISDEVGKGLPLWTPKGSFVRKKLEDYMYDKEQSYGYDYVYTPIMTKASLYEKSGHLAHYKDDMYSPMDIDGEDYYLRPMNCPHHHQIFNRKPVSYKELPIKLSEFGMVHRFEMSGVLTGLIRTRGFTQNDSHIYCSKSQLKTELLDVLKMFDEVYKDFNITDYWYRLSLPDFDNKEKYGDLDDTEMWSESTRLTREALQEYGAKFVEEGGEAAFYGPKIDVQIKNVLGKEDTIATVQVDFYSAKKFDINFTNDKGQKEPVVIIHRAIMGSFERFFGFLLEQTAGNFPTWLAPEQVRIVPVADAHSEYAHKVLAGLEMVGIRATLKEASDSLGKRIRNAKKDKIPYTLVLGDKEQKAHSVTAEMRDGNKLELSVNDFVERVKKEITERTA